MIDTIRLEIHDLKTHKQIYNIISQYKTGHKKYQVVPGTVMNLKKSVIEFKDTDKYFESHQKTSSYKASSNYEVNYIVKPYKGEFGSITVEFSIPKYFYGTNVIQLVENYDEPKFKNIKGKTDQIHNQLFKLYPRLIKYIDAFFRHEFPNVNVDKKKVEIRRVDCCYNQVFRTKFEALKYFDVIKRIDLNNAAKKTLFESKDNDGKTLMFKKNDHSIKVYYKGAEYEKNDRKEHEKVNLNRDEMIFNTKRLQEIADKTLRYEVTFRPGKMSYIYNNGIFRTSVKEWQGLRKLYEKCRYIFEANNILEKIKNREERLKKIYGKERERKKLETEIKQLKEQINRGEVERIQRQKVRELIGTMRKGLLTGWNNNYMEILYNKYQPKDETISSWLKMFRQFTKDFGKVINKGRTFWLELSEEGSLLYKMDKDSMAWEFSTVEKVLFSKEFVNEMILFLFGCVGELKASQRHSLQHYADLIDKINRQIENDNIRRKSVLGLEGRKKFRRKKKLDKNHWMNLLVILQTMTLREWREMFDIKKSTYYDTQKTLKEKLKIDKGTLFEIPLYPAPIDFDNYYYETNPIKGNVFVKQVGYMIFV